MTASTRVAGDLLELGAEVVEREVVAVSERLGHDADEPEHARAPDGEGQAEGPSAMYAVKSPVGHGPSRLGVGDVEELVVRPAREADAQRVPDGAVRAVAAAQVGAVPRSSPPGVRRRGADAVVGLREAGELGVPLDGVAGRAEAVDQEALVVVLGEAEDERERADALADVAEAGRRRARRPVRKWMRSSRNPPATTSSAMPSWR